MIGLIKNAVSHAAKNKNVQEGAKKIAVAGVTAASSNPIVKILTTAFDMSQNNVSRRASSAHVIPPEKVEEIVKNVSSSIVENDTTIFSELLINKIASGLSNGFKYVLLSPIHISSSLFYHFPLALWKGITLKPLTSNAINKGSEVILYFGQDPQTKELTVKAGEALFVIIRTAFIKGVLTILVIIIVYKIVSYTTNKIINMTKESNSDSFKAKVENEDDYS